MRKCGRLQEKQQEINLFFSCDEHVDNVSEAHGKQVKHLLCGF